MQSTLAVGTLTAGPLAGSLIGKTSLGRRRPNTAAPRPVSIRVVGAGEPQRSPQYDAADRLRRFRRISRRDITAVDSGPAAFVADRASSSRSLGCRRRTDKRPTLDPVSPTAIAVVAGNAARNAVGAGRRLPPVTGPNGAVRLRNAAKSAIILQPPQTRTHRPK